MSKFIKAFVSKPYRNPLILSKNLNPVRSYVAVVIVDGRIGERLTGVIFHNQTAKGQIQHHALVRGHGQLPVKFVRGSGK